ncbi:MAG TPA: hypothetical protein VMU54_12090 [Planctomycetota bacterium]|nr:hypothetical protein [Planctomycetota bacterium]
MNAVAPDILPGAPGPDATCLSLKMSWSIPRLTPKRYWNKVTAPIRTTTPAQPFETRSAFGPSRPPLITQSAALANMNEIAVFAFIVAKPGRMLFSTATSNIHPATTINPTRPVATLDVTAKDRQMRMSRGEFKAMVPILLEPFPFRVIIIPELSSYQKLGARYSRSREE